MRRLLCIAAVMLVALAGWSGTAAAKKRCCFSAYISGVGVITSDWGQLSDDQIGTDRAVWAWKERMLLVYSESGRPNQPDLRLVRLGRRTIQPSTVTSLETSSTVRLKGPQPGQYIPVTRPGDCGRTGAKLRRGDVPEFVPRARADSGALAGFPRASMFLSVNNPYLISDQYCLYGHTLNNIAAEVWDRQPCYGHHAFSLPAPRRAWLRRGTRRVERTVECHEIHEPDAEFYVNHRTTAAGDFRVSLSWFPRRQLKNRVRALREEHRESVPGEGPH